MTTRADLWNSGAATNERPPMDEIANRRNQLRLRMLPYRTPGGEFVDTLESRPQLVLVEGHGDALQRRQVPCRGELMIVSPFSQCRNSRHHDHRLAELERCQDRPHSGMGHDDRG